MNSVGNWFINLVRAASKDEHGTETVEWIAMAAVVILLLLTISPVLSAGGDTIGQGIVQSTACWANRWSGSGGCGGNEIAVGGNGGEGTSPAFSLTTNFGQIEYTPPFLINRLNDSQIFAPTQDSTLMNILETGQFTLFGDEGAEAIGESAETELEQVYAELENLYTERAEFLESRSGWRRVTEFLGDHNPFAESSEEAYNARISELEEHAAVLNMLATTHQNHLSERWMDLDTEDIERGANEFTDDEHNIFIQSIFDPEVRHKPTTVDEYSVIVRLPDGATSQEYLAGMAADVDDFTGGPVTERSEFKRWGDEVAIGQVYDINLKSRVPLIGVGLDLNRFNAPVLITDYDPDSHFTVQTLELNGREHPVHGTRQWGFHELPDGSVQFYTRGISVEDVLIAEILGRSGESDQWRSWRESLEAKVIADGGSVVPDSQVTFQGTGPSGAELMESWSPEERAAFNQRQVHDLEAEVSRLEAQRDAIPSEPGYKGHNIRRRSQIQRQINERQNQIEGYD